MAKMNASSGPGSLGGFIAGIILSMIGLFFSPILLVIGIVLIVQNRGAFSEKTEKSPPRTSAPQKPVRSSQPRPVKSAQPVPRRSGSVSYHSNAQDHYHITNAGLSVERRLEQLEVMKNAGLLDKEEYQQRLQKILRDR